MEAVSRLLVGLGARLAELLGPSRCPGCERRASFFCERCLDTLRDAETAWRSWPVPTFGRLSYAGALAEAIRRFKYGDRPDLGGPLGALLAADAAGLEPVDVVVPVPLHPRRLSERGYNQSTLLARPVARSLRAPLRAGALRRIVDTAAQARLGAAERRGNVMRAFAVPDPATVCGRRVLLVDDVATTGSTLGACATALVSAGSADVRALVLARAEEIDDDDVREP
jgi:ComF family protein